MQRTALFPRSALRVGQLLRALAGLRHALHDRLGIQFRRSFVAKAVLTVLSPFPPGLAGWVNARRAIIRPAWRTVRCGA
jgi:hypothetical protein